MGGVSEPALAPDRGDDFLEKTRDPDVWQKTQVAAKNVGGWTVRTLVMIATEIFTRKVSNALDGVL